MGILVEVERLRLNYLWRKRNKKNHTRIGVPSNIERIKIGDYTYGMLNVRNEGLENWLIIGKFCSIATGVFFIVDAEHPQNFLTTFPIHSYILKDGKKDSISKGTIELKDDVWVASNAVILSGVTVGQGAVIAAGAIVNKNVPPYALAAGVPAKIIKYRFSKEIIDYLLTLDYEKLDGELIKSHVNDFQTDISGMTLDEIKNLYKWFPKKKE